MKTRFDLDAELLRYIFIGLAWGFDIVAFVWVIGIICGMLGLPKAALFMIVILGSFFGAAILQANSWSPGNFLFLNKKGDKKFGIVLFVILCVAMFL